MAQNRFMLIQPDILEPPVGKFYPFIMFDTYRSYFLTLKNIYYRPNQYYGQIKEYLPFVSAIGLCKLKSRIAENPKNYMYKSYDSTTLIDTDDISKICSYKTHSIKDEHKYLDVYNELKSKYSNLVDKKFSEINYKKYLDPDSDNDREYLHFVMPKNFDLTIHTLKSIKGMYFFQDIPKSGAPKDFEIKNLVLPVTDTSEQTKVEITIYSNDIIIRNLIAPNYTIEFSLLSLSNINKLVIENIECSGLIIPHNCKINNIKINDGEVPIIKFGASNRKAEIDNLTINTKKIINIANGIKINNIIGDTTKIITDGNSNTTNNVCKDKIFVITGAISGWTRDELIRKIENSGGKVASTITSKTDYLLCEDLSNSSKSKKALAYGTTILSGESLRAFVNSLRTIV